MISIFANPGQTVSLVVQTVDGYGTRADGYEVPKVDAIYFPNSTAASGYPQNMTLVSTGLYRFTFTLPSGSSALGTFIASVSWPHPEFSHLQYEVFLINVAMPFGNISISPA